MHSEYQTDSGDLLDIESYFLTLYLVFFPEPIFSTFPKSISSLSLFITVF